MRHTRKKISTYERRSDEGDIEWDRFILAETLNPRQLGKRSDPRKDRISGHCEGVHVMRDGEEHER